MSGPEINVEQTTFFLEGALTSGELGVADRSAVEQFGRGADADILSEIGYDISSSVERVLTTDLENDEERLEDLARQSEQDYNQAHLRRNYLRALIRDFGKQRQTEGFATQHDQEPEDRLALEAANARYQANSEAQLKRACAVCVHAGGCALKNNMERWFTTHPYAKSDKKRRYHWELPYSPKIVEGRMKLLRRLEKDSLAPCIPEKDIADTQKSAA